MGANVLVQAQFLFSSIPSLRQRKHIAAKEVYCPLNGQSGWGSEKE